ncbi:MULTISPECIES: caspase family protein [unclassified Streptomyces]|uniref:effector-associated domain 2-containing protein n=1 Tax=unclassified Streptomyces TaxID=2593676 RepID=UPI002254188B|nr:MULTISPECIES: caspase family protein [unclassified Streptomyces]MCX5143044.1 caspase family protein [Streptomyces sp. NBC_00338]WRZ67479.1 caspase family protein [Streptomyces sp. NBC_01257]WSU61466.1 caspase family protein [Streptomyces sp. NBC_01104]
MRALVVGVESYEAGSAWNLDGPVRDALGYARWLRELGVGDDSLTLLLSPLEHNRRLADECGLPCRPADRNTVHQVLTRELANERSDWLFVVWSGHGLIDADRNRRLLYSDAHHRDLRCLDVEAVLAMFRSDGAPGHPRQLWLFDACQTYADPATTAGVLRPDPIPRWTERRQADQHVLFACGPGEATRNGMNAGVFSTEALRLLHEHPDWRLSPRPLADALRGRFGTTTSLWFEGDGEARRTAVQHKVPGRKLDLSDKRRLRDALAAVGVMRQPESRSQVIALLPPEIAGSVARSGVMLLEILDLVETCLAFGDGLTHLWSAVSLADPGTTALDDLLEVFRAYPEWFTPPALDMN